MHTVSLFPDRLPYSVEKILLVLIIIVTATATESRAQTDITFKVNLTPQLEDSTFIPGTDRIYLRGDRYPLGNNNKIYLKDVSPADSVYEATVNFPASERGKRLMYNFYIYKEEKNETKTEDMKRSLNIRSEDQEVGPVYFNSFAW